MAGQTRVNGSGLSVAATVYSPGATAFKIIVKIANGTAVDLRAEDDALDETVEQICKEINPLVYMTTNDNSGTMTVVCDSNATAGDLQARIRTIGTASNYPTSTVTAVGPNTIDTSGTLVTAAATLTAT
jgi:preprotein translocase subunit SecF|tara:strand:+ start:444 stop:830 length:387 start_codon:yes stop_codon:yes gene_type:complete